MRSVKLALCFVLALSFLTIYPEPKTSNAIVGWVGAAGSPYVGSATTQPMDINISRNSGKSWYCLNFVLDVNNYPHVVWMDNTINASAHDVYYVHWNGSNWVGANGSFYDPTSSSQPFDINVSRTAGDSWAPCIQLDKNGNPHISWGENSVYDLYYVKWNGSNWVGADGFAYDPLKPIQTKEINVTRTQGLEDGYNGFVLDGNNNPHFVWSYNGYYGIYYARWNGTDWVGADGSLYIPSGPNNLDVSVSRHGTWNAACKVILDKNDIPHIVYHDNAYNWFDVIYLKWSKKDKNWVGAAGSIYDPAISPPPDINVSRSPRADLGPSIQIDSKGNPNITWTYSTHGSGDDQVFFVKWNGADWVGVDGSIYNPVTAYGNKGINIRRYNSSNGAGGPGFVLDSNDNPYVCWHDNRNGQVDLYITKWNGSDWVGIADSPYVPAQTAQPSDINVSSSVGASGGLISLDSQGLPNLILQDDSFGGQTEMLFVKWSSNFDGTFNITKSVDTNSDGDYSDSGKNVSAGDTLRYKINWKFNQGQDALENPYLYDTVPDGTTYVSGSASPTANISYSLDGGATWIAGEPPNGSPAGTQLRWSIAANSWVGAAGSPYVGSAIPQPYDINLSNNASASTRSSLTIDSLGNPCIAWVDTASGNGEIMFAKWNGTAWTNAAGLAFTIANGNISNNGGGSSSPSLALDSSNRPCVVWADNTPGNMEIYFARWNGTSWVNANGSALTSTNGNVSNDSDTSQSPSVAIDSQGNPHIAWCNWMTTDYEILYTKWNGTGWVNASGTTMSTANANFTNDTENNYLPCLKLDSTDNPWIAWYITPVTNYEIMLGHWDGTSWVNVSGLALTVASANVSNNSGISFEPSLVLDHSGRPCIAWYDNVAGNFDIYFTRWNGTNWVTANGSVLTATNGNCSNNSGMSNLPRLAIDSNNNPHIVWYDDVLNPGTNSIFYIKWNGSAWVNVFGTAATPANSNVSNTTYRTYFADLKLNSNDMPYITWDQYAPAATDIYFVRFGIDSSQFMFSVKIDNPATSYGICNHATFRHKWDNGVATESNEVCNTIKYNFTGTFTLGKGVDANGDGKYTDNGATVLPGTTLSYKLDWTFDNPNNDPLNGAYIYDTVPPGTKYVAGSSPTYNLSYSVDNGFTWHPGEPPDGSVAGTKLRWKIRQPGWTNAQGQLINATNPNVSRNAGISDFPSCAVYKDGNPSIAWSDDVLGTTMVFYAKWNGTQWVNAAGLPFTAANGNVASLSGGDPSLALDPATGNPWIGFQSNGILFSNLEIHVVKWNGSQWTNASGTPATLINTDVSNNAGLSWFPSQLVLDSKGYPCMVWKDNTTGSFQNYFARWNGTNWVNASGTILNTTNGSMNNNVVNSFWPTISLDPNDRPYVAWDNNLGTNFEVYFAKWDGTQWVTASGTPLTPTNGNISNNSGSSQIPFLFTDRLTGNPCIAWSDDTPGNYEIYYAKWNGSGWVNASGTAIDTANPNMSHTTGGSYLLSLALDFNNLPAISWEDDTPGNSDIYYSIWNGSGWVNAKGDALTQTNGIVNLSPARSWFPSLAFDPVTNNPNIAWLDKTPGNNEVYFARWTDFSQTFTFAVKVDKPFSIPALSPICNSASFEHAFDGGNPLISNSVCVKVKGSSEVKGANLVVRKTAKSIQYNPDDTFEFQITVANNGSTAAENVVLMDNFPHELAFASSLPSGQAGYSSVKFAVGTLAPNASAIFSLKFRLSPKTTIDDCITVINEAIATSGTLIAKDSAAINICTPKAPCELYMDTKWTNVVKGVRSKGEPVKLEVIPMCGSSPYSVKVEWGDGSTVTGTVEGEGESFITEHSFAESSEFTVKITCVDAYGSTRILTKNLK